MILKKQGDTIWKEPEGIIEKNKKNRGWLEWSPNLVHLNRDKQKENGNTGSSFIYNWRAATVKRSSDACHYSCTSQFALSVWPWHITVRGQSSWWVSSGVSDLHKHTGPYETETGYKVYKFLNFICCKKEICAIFFLSPHPTTEHSSKRHSQIVGKHTELTWIELLKPHNLRIPLKLQKPLGSEVKHLQDPQPGQVAFEQVISKVMSEMASSKKIFGWIISSKMLNVDK